MPVPRGSRMTRRALERGMEAKSQEFRAEGAELYPGAFLRVTDLDDFDLCEYGKVPVLTAAVDEICRHHTHVVSHSGEARAVN